MKRTFAVTWDYRCPFARNGHTAVIRALADGADWDVRFVPFSLDQAHLEQGEPPVWERPPEQRGSGVLPLLWGIAVRDAHPERFPHFHLGVFAARFEEGRKTGKEEVLRDVAASAGLDPDRVAEEVDDGWPLDTLAREHGEAVERWSVFGVPTFIVGDEAVFVRLMEPHLTDDLERVLDLVGWTRVNEIKHTTVPR